MSTINEGSPLHITPTNDLLFRKTFASTGSEDILGGALSDFFGIHPDTKDIVLENPYSIKDYEELLDADVNDAVVVLRETKRDVTATFQEADFTSECQLKKEDFFNVRSIYYIFDKFCQNYNKRNELKTDATGKLLLYSALKPVYSLNIMGYNHFAEDQDALRVFTLHDKLRDKSFQKEYVSIAYFELEKPKVETANQKAWQHFFKTGFALPSAPEYIKRAAELTKYVNLSKEEKTVISTYELNEQRELNMLHAARNDAYAEAYTVAANEADSRWQAVVAEKDKEYAKVVSEKDAEIARLRARLQQN
jgi:hypothetical protein